MLEYNKAMHLYHVILLKGEYLCSVITAARTEEHVQGYAYNDGNRNSAGHIFQRCINSTFSAVLQQQYHNILMKKVKRVFRYFLLPVFLLTSVYLLITETRDSATVLPDGWKVIRPPHEVSALVEQDEIIWAGGRDGVSAVDRSSGKILKTLDTKPALEYVRDLVIDGKGILWIAHKSGLTAYDGMNFKTYTSHNGLPGDIVYDLLIDKRGRLWAGTSSGAVYMEDGALRQFPQNDILLHGMTAEIFEDNDGGMWFGSYAAPRGGITYVNGDFHQYFTGDELPHANITVIMQDSMGRIRAGTGLAESGGAAVFQKEGGSWVIKSTLCKDDGLAGEKVRSLFEYDDKMLLIGSEYDGLACFINGGSFIITSDDGLCHDEIKIMIKDTDNSLWIGTRDGITVISGPAWNKLVQSGLKGE